MKYDKLSLLLCLNVLLLSQTYAQYSLIDPYRLDFVNWTSTTFPQLGNIPQYVNSNSQIIYNSELPPVAASYWGEYVIVLREHPITQQPDGAMIFIEDFPLSYKMELVSFPVVPNCWNDANNCSSINNNRILTMPDEPYDNLRKGWGTGTNPTAYLYKVRENGSFFVPGTPAGTHLSGADGHPEALVTTHFNSVNPPPSSLSAWRYNLPHSVIKSSIYVHCNSDPTVIIDTIEWVYDNTRGRMRFYPFIDNNLNNTDPINYDVMFVPEIISKFEDHHSYFESNNSTWFDGGTKNYFPFNLDFPINYCSSSINNYFPGVLSSDLFRFYDVSSQSYDLYYGKAPGYSLLNVPLRNNTSQAFAGYRIITPFNNQIQIPNNFKGIQHDYIIDRGYPDLDLSIINQGQNTIYNPSEVIIDPGTNPPISIIFPEGYTFKTILGRYPSEAEVDDALNDIQNGVYDNYLDIPVPVNASDLSPIPDPINYPAVTWDDPTTIDPNGFYNDERYGYYKIMNNASIFVDKCVKLFDARFSVEDGGTLEFYDRLTTLGYENVTIPVTGNNHGRYKIRGEGGAILRNYENIQYVQNGNIIQSRPLHYIAWDAIVAGEQVDPNIDQPPGDYSIMPGSDVTFQTQGYIHLTNGFSVQGGDFHALVSLAIQSPLACSAQNRIVTQSAKENSRKKTIGVNYKASCVPNPNNGSMDIEADNMQSYVITNAIGQEVKRVDGINSNKEKIQLDEDSKGLHFVKVISNSGETAVVKVIVE